MSGYYPIEIEAGVGYPLSLYYGGKATPIDIHGWTGRMQIRATKTKQLLVDVSVSPNSIVVANDASGLISILIDPTVTATLPTGPGAVAMEYDLIIDPPGGLGPLTAKVLRGTVVATPQVTVPA